MPGPSRPLLGRIPLPIVVPMLVLLLGGHVVAQSAGPVPPTPAASLVPEALHFLIQDTWNEPDPNDGQSVEWSTGNFTIQGALPLAWLHTATSGDGEALGAPWPATGSQQHGWYDGDTCAGDVLVDCGTCTMTWISQWGEAPRLTVVERDATTVAVDDWSTAVPSAADQQFVQPGCANALGTTDFGHTGMGHVELDVTLDGGTPTAITIQPGFDLSRNQRFVSPYETLAVHLLP